MKLWEYANENILNMETIISCETGISIQFAPSHWGNNEATKYPFAINLLDEDAELIDSLRELTFEEAKEFAENMLKFLKDLEEKQIV
jgi:hypothetical protein